MDLNEDFINIQGILLSIEKTSGSLSKIKYRGGNESVILNVTTELHKFLSSKNYIKNKEINKSFAQKLEEICLFLILNTELKQAINEPAFQHLINITPQLSTCLLANTIIALDLSPYYCRALQRFDLNITEQFLSEMIPCTKKCKPKIHLTNAYEFLKLIVIKTSVSTDLNGIEKLTDIASQMLLNLTGLHGEQISNVRIDSVYECMGLTLLNLLDLLLTSDEKNLNLGILIEKIIKTCCSVMMAVTLDVFCSWAEVQYNGEILQIQIAGKSYAFIEKYQKFKPAKELIGMLGTIAQKPKTISEQIHSSDVPTIIKMINKSDSNQKDWFIALLNTQVLKCKDSINCISKWANLCSIDDVSRLLNLSVMTDELEAKSLVVKCAATLELDDLVLATTRHFHQNGINRNLNDNLQPQLILFFNKIKDKNMETEFCKELYLLVLQNPEQTLTYVFNQCSKNTFYSYNLATFWPYIKEIITINDFGMQILKNELTTNGFTELNYKNYTQLFNALVDSGIYSSDTIALNIILPILQDSNNNQNHQLVKFSLEILKDLQGNIFLGDSTVILFNFLLELMKLYRCNFLNFHFLKQEITKLCVEVIEKYSDINSNITYKAQEFNSDDFFVSFYAEKLFEKSFNSNVLNYFFPINFGRHAEAISHLIKIMPLCVTPEWLMLSTNLVNFCGIEKTVEMFCDSLILLCELVNSQETKTREVQCMYVGLAYCLQSLGVVIKECIQPKISNLQEDIAITKHVCSLLRDIPSGSLKSDEGLALASLLSDKSLKSLKPDKNFANLVASIDENNICKMLAKKILS